MENSILKSTKKVLGVQPDDTDFDTDILMHINSVFFTLTQLGIGPTGGYRIEDDEPTWDLFYGADPRFDAVKTYMYLRVRLLFDPPTVGYHVDALKEQIVEHAWRLSVMVEETAWVNPTPPVIPEEEYYIFEGGEV